MAAEIVLPLRDAGMDVAFDDLERNLEVVLAAGPRTLVLDMGAVERVSSTVVAVLLWTRRRCSSQGVELVLRRPSRRLQETLDRTGLSQVLAVEGADRPGGTSRPGVRAGGGR